MKIDSKQAVLSLCTALALAGCGSGGSTAEVSIQDAPPPGVTSVKLTIASMQVHVAGDSADKSDPNDKTIDDDGDWQTLTVNQQIDLVQHQGESAAMVLGQLDLPPGKITQLRLKLDTSKPELNTATDAHGVCNLDVARVDKKGIKINHVFKAFQSKGAKQQIFVDLPLDLSLTQSGGCYVLDPKLKLFKVKTDGKDESL